MLQPENQPKKYEHLFNDIDRGIIKLPKFQRDFVWGKEQTASLIDSVLKGYPIGTFILWKTKEELRHFKNIGNANLPAKRKGDYVQYVLDGQQRITSLYAVRKGLIITKDGVEIDYKDITIDLNKKSESDENIVLTFAEEEGNTISVYKLLNGIFTEFLDEYDKESLRKIEIYKQRLTGYDFSTILITEYPLDIACDIFTRINTGGTELSLFEIMVAKTYDHKLNFDLAEEYDKLIDSKNSEKDLITANYETIPSQVILQCISAHLTKQIRRKDILKLNKTKFIKEWLTVKEGIFTAIDYFRSYFRIKVSRILPYNILLVPFTYFFIKNKFKNPTKIQNKLLSQYFWWASLSSRFSNAQESKIASDLKKIDKILKGQQPSYRGEEVNLIEEDLMYHWFSTGDAFCKTILCLYSYFEPKSFGSNSIINLDNSWLKAANSRNYHHFFPKSHLKGRGFELWEANTIVNITLIDAYTNKNVIRTKPPKTYLKKFIKENDNFEESMSSHLIRVDTYGIWEDDYEMFLKKRAHKILLEINKRLNPKI